MTKSGECEKVVSSNGWIRSKHQVRKGHVLIFTQRSQTFYLFFPNVYAVNVMQAISPFHDVSALDVLVLLNAAVNKSKSKVRLYHSAL